MCDPFNPAIALVRSSRTREPTGLQSRESLRPGVSPAQTLASGLTSIGAIQRLLAAGSHVQTKRNTLRLHRGRMNCSSYWRQLRRRLATGPAVPTRPGLAATPEARRAATRGRCRAPRPGGAGAHAGCCPSSRQPESSSAPAQPGQFRALQACRDRELRSAGAREPAVSRGPSQERPSLASYWPHGG